MAKKIKRTDLDVISEAFEILKEKGVIHASVADTEDNGETGLFIYNREPDNDHLDPTYNLLFNSDGSFKAAR